MVRTPLTTAPMIGTPTDASRRWARSTSGNRLVSYRTASRAPSAQRPTVRASGTSSTGVAMSIEAVMREYGLPTGAAELTALLGGSDGPASAGEAPAGKKWWKLW